MPDTTKEQLQLRRDEIREQLAQHNGEINIELDQDPEEQAIQIEQHEVAVALIDNLRRELAAVEDKLLDYEN
jgi:RNA polymerase-binding transcription factor DksA